MAKVIGPNGLVLTVPDHVASAMVRAGKIRYADEPNTLATTDHAMDTEPAVPTAAKRPRAKQQVG